MNMKLTLCLRERLIDLHIRLFEIGAIFGW